MAISRHTVILGETPGLRVEVQTRTGPEGTTEDVAWINVQERDGYLVVEIVRRKNDPEIHARLPGGTVVW